MKLVRADGHRQYQWALTNLHTQTIASILSEHINDTDLLLAIARILQNLNGEVYDSLDLELASVRALYKLIGSEERSAIPDYVTELLQAVYELYHQPRSVLYSSLKDQINSLRGAVVERLALELIGPRYLQNDECANSRRFVDQHNRTITLHEIDIAALSHDKRQLEGYECKMRAVAFENHDRLDLEYLHRVATEEDYRVQVGVISLDPSKLIEKRLRRLNASSCVQAFGVDVLRELQYSPFE